MNISETDSRIDALKVLRDKIARAIDETESGRDLAALSKQLRETLAEIEDLEDTKTERQDQTVLSIIRGKHKG